MNEDEQDYSLVVEPPPEPQGDGFTVDTSPIIKNLLRARDEFPGDWVRIATYGNKGSATVVASNLRTRRRPKNMPDGEWEFRSGALPDDETSFGVWAKYLGPKVEVNVQPQP